MLLGVAISANGCSHIGPEFAAVGGVVTLDGKPITGAGVMFAPINGGPVASATTDDTGRFRLQTLSHKGALVGEHAISVTKGHTDVRQVANSSMPLMQYIPEIPQRYTRRETSELKAIVSTNTTLNDFTLALTSK